MLQVVWGRYLFHVLILLAVILLWRRRLPHTRQLRRPIVRALCQFGAVLCLVGALALLPLAEVTAILFTSPLFMILISIPLLHERVGPHRLGAVLVGLLAVLMIVQPGGEAWHPTALLLAFLAAVATAFYQAITRLLGAAEAPLSSLFIMGWVSLGLLTPIVPLYWVSLSAEAWLLLATQGIVSIACHLGIIRALQDAPLSALAPFQYVSFASAVLVGYLVFGDLPDSWTWLGTILIILAGLHVYHREARVLRANRGWGSRLAGPR